MLSPVSSRVVNDMACALLSAGVTADDHEGAVAALQASRYGRGAILAFADLARERAREIAALAVVAAGLVPLPAAAMQAGQHALERAPELVATADGVRIAAIWGFALGACAGMFVMALVRTVIR